MQTVSLVSKQAFQKFHQGELFPLPSPLPTKAMHLKLGKDESKVIVETPESKIALNPIDAQLLAVAILDRLAENGWILDSTVHEIQALFFPPDDDDEVADED